MPDATCILKTTKVSLGDEAPGDRQQGRLHEEVNVTGAPGNLRVVLKVNFMLHILYQNIF